MDFMNILATVPNGIWETIIMWIESWAGTYILSIILLTVVIKVLWVPLDFFNRKATSKQTEMTNKLKPEIEKIQKKYANDKTLQNQKLGELYKRNNFNMMSGCLFMLVYLGLNMFIFFSLFAGLNSMSQYKITQQYEDIKNVYANELAIELTTTSYDDWEFKSYSNQEILDMLANPMLTDEKKEEVILKVQVQFEDKSESFLWIGNIWKSDVPWTNSIPTFEEYAEMAKLADQFKDLTEEQKTAAMNEEKAVYESFINPIRSNVGRPNGYMICTILSVVAAFFSAWLMSKRGKKSVDLANQTPFGGGGAVSAVAPNKFMLIFLPAMMGVFSLITNSVFAIYMIVSQLVTIVFTPLINKLIRESSKKEEEKRKDEIVVEYSRDAVWSNKKNKR